MKGKHIETIYTKRQRLSISFFLLFAKLSKLSNIWFRVPFLIGMFIFFCPSLIAQIVIGGFEPDSSAILDLQSTSQGLLMPRLTQDQRDSIVAPAEGLLIYNLTTHCLEINMNTSVKPIWISIDCLGVIDTLYCSGVNISQGLTVQTPSANRLVTVNYSGGNGGAFPTQRLISEGVDGVTGTVYAGHFADGDGSLSIHLEGIPKDTGQIILDLELGGKACDIQLDVEPGLIVELLCDEAIFSNVLVRGSASDSIMMRIPYLGGNGGPFSKDSLASFGVPGLNGLLLDSFFAIGDGILEYMLYGSADSSGIGYFHLSIGQQQCSVQLHIVDTGEVYFPAGYQHCDEANPTIVVEVVNPTTGRIWMDRNLGASRVATSGDDAQAYGDIYQWGRFADGHHCRNSAATSMNATTAVPNSGNLWDGKFITEDSSPNDWLVSPNDNLWQGVNGVNNPCPNGFRLPYISEFEAERQSWDSNNAGGAFGSPLRFPVAGRRLHYSGANSFASFGVYWSGSISGSNARSLYFDGGNAALNFEATRAWGYSVRCIKD